MVMRYHWGLAVGHLYTHNRATMEHCDSADLEAIDCSAMENPVTNEPMQNATASSRGRAGNRTLDLSASDIDIAELDLRNREDDEWEDVGTDDGDDLGEESDDDVFAAMDEMY